jgi:polyisoprenyl-teichoic acid--peptidoglycan teichoic acid transferase
MSNNLPRSEATTPFRNVSQASNGQILKRAWWILFLNLLIPGSAQVLAGSKKMGRLGILFTLGFWGFLILAILLALVSKVALLTVLMTPFIAIPLGILFIIYAALIAFLSLDSIRLMNLKLSTSRTKPVLLVLGLVSAIVSSYLVGTIGSSTLAASNFVSGTFYNSNSLETHKGRYNILLLGGDSGSDRFGLRPDSISVMSISAETGNAVNIGLPRNLSRIQFTEGTPIHKVYPYGFNHDCGGDCMLNAIYKATIDNYSYLYPDAHNHGSTSGIEATKSAVQWITGLKIDAYVLINMRNFAGLIDAIGGIDVTVKKALPIGGQQDCYPSSQPSDPAEQAKYRDGTYCPDVMSWIEKGKQHMDGRTALWYARSRHNTNDYDRMKRQRQVENIVLKKIDLTTLLFKFGAVAGASSKLIRTDIPASAVPTLIDLAFKAKAKGIQALPLTNADDSRINASNPDYWLIRHKIAQKIKKYS